MALTENNYVGNGSTVLYSFTFPYLATTDIKVSLDGVITTAYSLANATTVQFNSAPSNGTKIRIYRETADASLSSTFYPGSSIRSQDLNNNFTQNLYVTQESRNTASSATTTANTALTNSAAAVSTANTASSNASSAVSTANTASANATTAVNTANAASATAASAVSTANTASSNATTAVTTANTALSTANAATTTANNASSQAASAVSTANTASSNASSAVSTANTASSNATNAVNSANSAVSTANSATTTANSAVVTANTANSKADQAIAAVSNSINYQLKANVAAIPASPANDTYIEIQDSTGLESFTPLAGMPAGFVGDSGLSVRLRYTTAGTTWNWLNYYANNSDSRYLKLTGGTLTGQIKADDSTSAATPGYAFDGDPNTGIGRPGVDELALITGGTARLTIDSSGSVSVAGALTKGGNNVVTVGDTGTVTSAMVADGTLVNADINASAAIAGTKISPDFGSQNTTTTGTSTAASFIPTSSTAPTNGVYLPSANNVAISTNGAGKLFINSAGDIGIGAAPSGSYKLEVKGGATDSVAIFDSTNAVGPHLRFSTSGTDRHYLGSAPGFTGGGTSSDFAIRTAGYLALSTGGNNERLRITSDGKLGLGTSSPAERLHVVDSAATVRIDSSAGNDIQVRFQQGSTFVGAVGYDSSEGCVYLNRFGDATKGLVVNSSNNVGIGTALPSEALTVGSGNVQITGGQLAIGSLGSSGLQFINNGTIGTVDSIPLILRTAATERARIDTSGRLLVGTSSDRSSAGVNGRFQLEGTSYNTSSVNLINNGNDNQPSYLVFGKSRSGSVGGNTVVQSGDYLGRIDFAGADGSNLSSLGAFIGCQVDGTPGAGDMPGRLVFSTTADGASSPTERFRIDNAGLLFSTPTYNDTTTNAANVVIASTGRFSRSTSSIKYKTDVETLSDSYANAVLQCRPVWYRSLSSNDNPAWGYWGFIAEEVAEIDPRLVSWKTVETSHDENGSVVETPCDPEPEGVQYDRFVPHLLNLIKRQGEAIAELQAEVAALKGA